MLAGGASDTGMTSAVPFSPATPSTKRSSLVKVPVLSKAHTSIYRGEREMWVEFEPQRPIRHGYEHDIRRVGSRRVGLRPLRTPVLCLYPNPLKTQLGELCKVSSEISDSRN